MIWRWFKLALAGLLSLLVFTYAPRAPTSQSLSDFVTGAKQAKEGGGLFGSMEVRSGSLKGLPQWTRVLGAARRDSAAFDSCAASAGACGTAVLKRWHEVVAAASGQSPRDRLKTVNDFFNAWPYKQDQELYGVREYWATPKEFMSRSGDCEDYAIAKYFALRKLGFSADDLRIVVLRDRIRGIGHAVVAVYVDGDILILDNLSKLIVSHKRYKHYIPQVSLNETTRWAHVGGFEKPQATVFQRPSLYKRN